MYSKAQKRLGQMLMDKGLITSGQLDFALSEQHSSKEFLGTILLKHSIIKEEDLLKALSEQFRIPYVALKDKYIPWNFVGRFSSTLIFEHRCFPVSHDEWSVTFALINPLDLWALKRAEEESKGLKTKFVLVTTRDMDEALLRYRQYMRGNISKLF
ncbi:MAG: hypothetical protein ACM3IL_01775 [Deltaproteobacteria bacterium]